MPVFSWSPPGDVPAVGDPAFGGLLEGNLLPQDAAGGLRTAAEVIAGLTGAPAISELAGEARALAVFRDAAGGLSDFLCEGLFRCLSFPYCEPCVLSTP